MEDGADDLISKDASFASRIKQHAKRRFSRKGSYDLSMNNNFAPRFKVKALASDGVVVDSLDKEASNAAVDEVFSLPGSFEAKNKPDVVISVSAREGISVTSKKDKLICHYKIHEVGYCNVDKRYPEVVVFVAADSHNQLKCHMFLCEDAPKARAICLALARAFQTSFEMWQKNKEFISDINRLKLESRRRSAGDAFTLPSNRLHSRRSSDFVTVVNQPRFRSEKRNSDFTGIPEKKLLDFRRGGSAKMARDFPDPPRDETIDAETDRAWQLLSTSAEKGKCPLLRRGSEDWEAFEQDEEIRSKMKGDHLLWDEEDI